jgi:hypothetical protein
MSSVWPFVPEIGATETFEYKTEVLKSYTQEQRLRLRDKPRYILNYTFVLDDEQYAVAKSFAKRLNQTGLYQVPVWQEAFPFVGTISTSDTTIAVDTTAYKFSGIELLVWKDWDDYALCPIQSLTATTITLSAPVGKTLVNPYVVPVKRMRVYQPIEVASGAPNNHRVSARFNSIDHTNYIKVNDDLFNASDLFDYLDIFAWLFPTYKNITAVVNAPFRMQEVSSSLIRPVEMIDNGFGPIVVEPLLDFVEDRFTLDFFYQGNTQRVDTLAFICQFYGKQRPFWLPSFQNDIRLVAGTYSGTSLTVLAIGELSDYINENIFIRQLDGSYVFATITNAVLSGGNYVLTLEDTLSSTVSNTLTQSISFMKLSRFDTDTVEVTNGAGSSGRITMNSIEVPN